MAILLTGLTALYVWFVHNSNRLLIDLVNQESKGKLNLKLSNVTFNFFSNEVKIHKARISSTAKANTPITYQVSFQKVTLTTNSILAAFFKGSLEVRKLKLYDPVIEVFNWQNDSIKGSNNNLSLGMELGKLYHSIDDAITTLNTHSISLINARLILNNKTEPGKRPLVFSNIYFSLKKLNKPKSSPGKYLDNNNILFSSSNQDITLTDGIHKLSFKRLVIERAKNIILDSCTIVALPTQISHNSYNIYFKRLALTGVDFDALYKRNLIKADSVYCENPVSNIDLNTPSPDSNAAVREMPDPSKIIKEFAGDLDLGFVGVMDGDIHLNIKGRKRQSNIHSGKVNFQIKNLRINPDSTSLISINTFDMLIKGYKLYNADSSVVYSFDSIRFANNKLLLNNFSVHTSSGLNKIRDFVNYSMPYFELLGVDWPELIFKQNLKAREAVLHEPTINYKEVTKVDTVKKSIIFNSRHTFDDFMEIEMLKIVNGKININWNNYNSLQLQGFNLNLLGNNLTDYKHVRLQKDIESLFFTEGYLEAGGVVAQLRNVTFAANNQIRAGELLINKSTGGIDSRIENVSIKNIYTEEKNSNLVIEGLQWERGNIAINPVSHPKASVKPGSIVFKNISAGPTEFKFTSKGSEGSASIENLEISVLEKSNTGPVAINGVNLKGRDLNFSTASIRMNSSNFILGDASQEFTRTRFENHGYSGTLVINTPSIRITKDIRSFFTNDFHFSNVLLKGPVIDFHKQNNASTDGQKVSKATAMKIDHIKLQEPVVNVQLQHDESGKKFLLPYSKGSEIKVEDVDITEEQIKIASVNVKTQKAEITGIEKPLKIDNGLDMHLLKLNISDKGGISSWDVILSKLSMKNLAGFTFDIKKNTLLLKDITIGDCMLSSSTINNTGKLISTNPRAWISTSSAKYFTKNSLWQCFNLSYNAGNKMLVLDSVNYHPSMSRDSFIAANDYQVDYINFSSGKANLSGFDMIKYLNGESLSIQKASLNQPSISVFRDKFPPFSEGVRKDMFTEKIRNIPMPVSINQIEISDGKVSYTEKNAGNRLEGNLTLTRLNGNIFNIANEGLKRRDSLSLAFTGHLLDNAFFDLKLDQSYTDPLCGFNMALMLKPVNLLFLNPLLAPLSNVKFTSGIVDKFEMNAVGNENFARGEMEFYYHDLRIKLLRDGGMVRSRFIKPAESALVNTFVVKKENKETTGLIYFKRLKDRSFFNYMNKIIFSGITTSVGAKKNSRYRKKIEQEGLAR